MYKVYIIAGVLAYFVQTVTQEILNPPSVWVERSTINYKSDVGVVPGVRSCGGSGRLIQWRYEPCTVEDVPCRVPANSSILRCEVDFIPSKDIATLGLRFKVESLDGEVKSELIYPGPVELSETLRSGQMYTIFNAGGGGEELKGKTVTFQYILYDKDTNDVEVCAEADYLDY